MARKKSDGDAHMPGEDTRPADAAAKESGAVAKRTRAGSKSAAAGSTSARSGKPAAAGSPAARSGADAAARRPAARKPAAPKTLLTPDDLYLFNEGTHTQLWRKLGAHLVTMGRRKGVHFAVWAPNAEQVGVIGDFNGWDGDATPLKPHGDSGIWGGFVPGVARGALYKYRIRSRHDGYTVDKADPYGLLHETPPKTASVVWDLDYEWADAAWMGTRASRNALDAPISIYEVHLGSWMRVPEEGARPLTYRELAPKLADHVERMGFTHVELLPVTEHPFYGSWGYQATGYFAPTSRYGTPQDFMALIDHLHGRGIGVILDWVPSHFPNDEHGLAYFDGTHLYEHADPRLGYHPDWKSAIFNYGRNEVRSFLLSSALFWLDAYHADGLRVDAVASMLYLDYSRNPGEWIPNEFGGRENLEAISLLRRLNEEVYGRHPDVQTYAEESTAWPMVSRPTYLGGLGFGMKWDMGWMHDTLEYVSKEPVHRKYHQGELTFRMVYAFNENFVLPLSHDEVVHGKGSLLGRMPGDEWQQFANLRLLLAYMWSQPGKKLLFMGGELGQRSEWNHETSLEWHVLEHAPHEGVRRWVEELNRFYRAEPALWRRDFSPEGFEWVDASDAENSVIAYLRRAGADSEPDSGDEVHAGHERHARDEASAGDDVLAIFNFTPVPRPNYRIGVSHPGVWREVLNSDATEYGGSGQGNLGGVESAPAGAHGRPHSILVTLPPLGAVFFKPPV